MTKKGRQSKDKKSIAGQTKRNKQKDAYGVSYDRRKGFWTRIDKAILEEGRLLHSWLLPIRI